MPKSKRKPSLEPIQSKSLEHLWPLGIDHQHSKVPVPKYFPMTNPLSSLWASTFNAKIKEKTIIENHLEQKFGASLVTWHCSPTLKSSCTKILSYGKSLVKFGSRYFRCQNQRENSRWNPSRAKVWSIHGQLALPRNTQKSLYQNTSLWQIPCQVYEPVLSMGKIKVKTVVGTHLEQKFGASMATWHCPATLKSPRTKILPYDKSPVKFGRRYFRCQNQRENSHWNPSRAKV